VGELPERLGFPELTVEMAVTAVPVARLRLGLSYLQAEAAAAVVEFYRLHHQWFRAAWVVQGQAAEVVAEVMVVALAQPEPELPEVG
jgi:hypothetical protein